MEKINVFVIFIIGIALTSCEKENFIPENQTSFAKVLPPEVYAYSIEQHGITWSFASEQQYGQFANGDYWVVGPVKIINISNNYHNEGFTPSQKQDGSMINPGTNSNQGYDGTLNSYNPTLNVNYPNDQIISRDNVLLLGVNESLVTSVSWLYNSETDKETGTPRFNRGTNTPRPVLRTAAILTCLSEAPPEGSFRPPYCGSDKSIKYNKNKIKMSLLKNLSPSNITSIPDVAQIERQFQRVWLDHVYQSFGAYLHPSENMRHYGRDLAKDIGDAALILNLDFSSLPGSPSKDVLLYEFIQLGIDFAGIADNGGSWPPNGGFHMGRKWPILFAGIMLEDDHMKNVGNWSTVFQEDAQTFYVSQAEIDITNSNLWNPDSRINNPQPYSQSNLGLPEWGIRHATQPTRDALNWDATYRHINGVANSGFVLAAHIMEQTPTWNHQPLFDYMDRWWELTNGTYTSQITTPFTKSMWEEYRSTYAPIWVSE